MAVRRVPFCGQSAFAVCLALCLFAGSFVPTADGGNEELRTVRVGYQKYGSFNVVKAQGEFERLLAAKGIHVDWFLFPAGPQLLEALNAGSIDLGHTGEAPPIFAQAAGVPLVYIGNEPPYPAGEAILVPKDSKIRSVADLKGEKVALNKGSNVHYFLLKALEQAGLKYQDIHPVYLPPADARAAFEGGSVDAWAIWDPYLTAAQAATGARILVDGSNLVANREFFLGCRKFVEAHPDVIEALRESVEKASQWSTEKPQEVAKYLSPQVGIDVNILETIARRQPSGFNPIDASVISDQQRIADAFFQLNLIPKAVVVREAVITQP
ncbi:MAG: sulfonate ABC transporter substrate-binding protein [Verrucomicrobia bacterium]|nr:sulfonate ABC transporter substrate-binding protein [Verrucomicrobiota bacterium]